jgi:DNA-binding response OmpR family regulator
MSKLLIIEDDATIIEALEDTFVFHGFQVLTAANGKDGYELLTIHDPDLVILDVMLPGPDGFDICKKIRSQDPDVPIIMLTAKSQEMDKLLGFERGADDYVTKPFSVKELLARVQAVLKRSVKKPSPIEPKANKSKTVTVGCAAIDFKNFTVTRDGEEFPLSPKEYDILKLLVENPDEVIHRDRIMDEVWGDEYYPSPRTIDNFMLKLRTKIEEDPKNPKHIKTVHGAGYKFRF